MRRIISAGVFVWLAFLAVPSFAQAPENYVFIPGEWYRMPTHFGPATGPRKGPDRKAFDWTNSPKATVLSVSFLSKREQMQKLLPPGFAINGEPVVTVSMTYYTEIQWLAGRGYNTLGVSFPVTFTGKQDKATGTFLLILWENLTDPIITAAKNSASQSCMPNCLRRGCSAIARASPPVGSSFRSWKWSSRASRSRNCFHNSGGSPAINVRFRWTVGFVGNNVNLGTDIPLPEATPNQSVGVIGATAEYRAATMFNRTITSQDIIDIRSRQGRWMAFGRVTYEDIFGDSHSTEYCIEFEPSDGSAKLCAQWNMAT